MGYIDNITSDISEGIHITNMHNPNQSSNNINYIGQMLKHNDHFTGLDYMDNTLSSLALQGWCDIKFAKEFNIRSATD